MKILDVPRSGSYQGITSSRNRYGQYVRTRATPVNPASSFQMAVRARLGTNASNWRDLTTAQRYGWGTLGGQIVRNDSLGQAYTLTGFQAYCLVNNNNLAAGNAVVPDAVLYATPDQIASLTPTATTSTFSVAFTVTPLGTGERIFVSASPQRTAGRSFEGDFRLISVSAAAGTSPVNIFAAYQARFGSPITGNRIFVSVQRYLSGFLSLPIDTSIIVA